MKQFAMMKALARMAGLGILVLDFSTSAFALTLVTPTVDAFLGETFDCKVTNFSPTKSLAVTSVDIINEAGVSVKAADLCTGATLAPMTSCEFLNANNFRPAYCIATANGNFRMQLNDLDATSHLILVSPGTK
jgi:hypothetical protein